MDDHWPTVLELAPPAVPWAGSAAAIVGTLQARSAATPETEAGLVASGPLRTSGALEIAGKTVGFKFRAATNAGPLAVHFDSGAYAAAFDVMRLRARRKGLDALMRLCVELASAGRAEGFRLRFDAASAEPVGIQALVSGLTSVDGEPGLIAGLSASSAHWPTVRSFWPGWLDMDGYQVKEFLS
ncbi:hypothetical protein [Variovorax sp. IB41]|uniref:hypothetical protein n=1 Tax=Variovorax sp. IB41 TaxID=2779370 RepID=UPI0018E8496D|nr:hypothetical protein [Variovorax sp. IB41]MBJ2157999.1 hypothetical protein [Variovorax sp. IB41]